MWEGQDGSGHDQHRGLTLLHGDPAVVADVAVIFSIAQCQMRPRPFPKSSRVESSQIWQSQSTRTQHASGNEDDKVSAYFEGDGGPDASTTISCCECSNDATPGTVGTVGWICWPPF